MLSVGTCLILAGIKRRDEEKMVITSKRVEQASKDITREDGGEMTKTPKQVDMARQALPRWQYLPPSRARDIIILGFVLTGVAIFLVGFLYVAIAFILVASIPMVVVGITRMMRAEMIKDDALRCFAASTGGRVSMDVLAAGMRVYPEQVRDVLTDLQAGRRKARHFTFHIDEPSGDVVLDATPPARTTRDTTPRPAGDDDDTLATWTIDQGDEP